MGWRRASSLRRAVSQARPKPAAQCRTPPTREVQWCLHATWCGLCVAVQPGRSSTEVVELHCSDCHWSSGSSSQSHARVTRPRRCDSQDFSNLPQLSVSYVPSGLSNALIPVSGLSTYSSLGRRYNRTHNYVCITPAVQ